VHREAIQMKDVELGGDWTVEAQPMVDLAEKGRSNMGRKTDRP
jgi:hypothetical protein